MTAELVTLEALVRAGALHIVTSVCAHPADVSCADAPVPRTSPAHFVCHQATRVELVGPDTVMVYSEEGDWVYGRVRDVLMKLVGDSVTGNGG